MKGRRKRRRVAPRREWARWAASRMALRLKLLLLGLLTLVLPWGGCRYARQMEAALREGQLNSLQAVAQTIAASLQGRTDLLYRETGRHEGSPETAGAQPQPAR